MRKLAFISICDFLRFTPKVLWMSLECLWRVQTKICNSSIHSTRESSKRVCGKVRKRKIGFCGNFTGIYKVKYSKFGYIK